MGQNITQITFSKQALETFRQRLQMNLQALQQILARPGFGVGPATFGAELELYLVNSQGRPVGRNIEVRDQLQDPQLTLELNRYNLEYNLTPVGVTPAPFSAMEQQILSALKRLDQVSAEYHAQVLPIGILPTLKRTDFGPRHMTGLCRFQTLTERLAELRGALFYIRIQGDKEAISLRSRDLTLEGANTSLQLHYRVDPRRFVDVFNAVQLVTPLVLAVSCNSPFLLGRRLWHETRIPLFRHAIDGYSNDHKTAQLPSRVDFGNGWVRQSAWELFAESVYLHPPLLPLSEGLAEVQSQVEAGVNPELFELQLHHGTVWPWNRAIYAPGKDGHLRIEMRALPAGPSAGDMMANAALLIGLAEGLAPEISRWTAALPYRTVVHNFYMAARQGVGARLLWPASNGGGLQTLGALELVHELLPLADNGLAKIGIHAAERRHYLDLIEARVVAGTSGASWQLRQFNRLSRKLSTSSSLGLLVQHYLNHAQANRPVAEWPDIT